MPFAVWTMRVLFTPFVLGSLGASVRLETGRDAPLSLMAKLNAAASEGKSFEVQQGSSEQTFLLAKDGYRGAGAFAVVFQVSKPAEEAKLVAKFLKMDPGPEEWPEVLRSVLSEELTRSAGQEHEVEVDWDLVHMAQDSFVKLISLGTVTEFGGEVPVQIWEDAGSQTLRNLLQSTDKIDAAKEGAVATKLLAVLYLLSLHGVEHGDIKSDNLMFDGQVFKVIDFDSMMRTDSSIDFDATIKLLKELRGKSVKSDQTTKGYRLALKLQKAQKDVTERLKLLVEASRAYSGI